MAAQPDRDGVVLPVTSHDGRVVFVLLTDLHQHHNVIKVYGPSLLFCRLPEKPPQTLHLGTLRGWLGLQSDTPIRWTEDSQPNVNLSVVSTPVSLNKITEAELHALQRLRGYMLSGTQLRLLTSLDGKIRVAHWRTTAGAGKTSMLGNAGYLATRRYNDVVLWLATKSKQMTHDAYKGIQKLFSYREVVLLMVDTDGGDIVNYEDAFLREVKTGRTEDNRIRLAALDRIVSILIFFAASVWNSSLATLRPHASGLPPRLPRCGWIRTRGRACSWGGWSSESRRLHFIWSHGYGRSAAFMVGTAKQAVHSLVCGRIGTAYES